MAEMKKIKVSWPLSRENAIKIGRFEYGQMEMLLQNTILSPQAQRELAASHNEDLSVMTLDGVDYYDSVNAKPEGKEFVPPEMISGETNGQYLERILVKRSEYREAWRRCVADYQKERKERLEKEEYNKVEAAKKASVQDLVHHSVDILQKSGRMKEVEAYCEEQKRKRLEAEAAIEAANKRKKEEKERRDEEEHEFLRKWVAENGTYEMKDRMEAEVLPWQEIRDAIADGVFPCKEALAEAGLEAVPAPKRRKMVCKNCSSQCGPEDMNEKGPVEMGKLSREHWELLCRAEELRPDGAECKWMKWRIWWECPGGGRAAENHDYIEVTFKVGPVTLKRYYEPIEGIEDKWFSDIDEEDD